MMKALLHGLGQRFVSLVVFIVGFLKLDNVERTPDENVTFMAHFFKDPLFDQCL